jgi:hypothetical protein
MHCKRCGLDNQKEVDAEINIHFPGLKNLDRPSVLASPKLLVCPDCGFAEFTLRESEVLLLATGAAATGGGLKSRLFTPPQGGAQVSNS